MPELVKITSDLFPKLYDAFLHDDDPLSDESDWRHVFDYQWAHDEDHTGYALLQDGKVIGMMAMAFSQRIIDGAAHKFCNLHTWWVHPDHRGHSVVMLRPLMALEGYTITHLTPCDRVRGLLKRLGFAELDLTMRLLLPLGPVRRADQHGDVTLAFDDAIDRSVLSADDRRILDDHSPYRVGNLVVTEGDRRGYVLYTTVERYRVRYCHIHFIGDEDLFARHEARIRAALMTRHGVRLVALDARRVEGRDFPRSFDFWAPAHGLYKPHGTIAPAEVDNLYSDVVMLRLATMPHVGHEIAQIARRWLPRPWGFPGLSASSRSDVRP